MVSTSTSRAIVVFHSARSSVLEKTILGMSRQIPANSATGPALDGSASAVGQYRAISSWVTRPSRKAPISPSCSLKWRCNSSSTRCQSIWRSGPSMKPSRDTEIIKTIFLSALLTGPVQEWEFAEPPATSYDHSSLPTATGGGASPPCRSAADR